MNNGLSLSKFSQRKRDCERCLWMVLRNIHDLVTGWVLEFSRRGSWNFPGGKESLVGAWKFPGGGPGIFQYPKNLFFLTCSGFEVKGPNTCSRAFLITDLL